MTPETIAAVGHELRSPLSSVRGYTHLLLERWDRIDDDQKKAMLAQVHHDAARISRLIGELLDASRLESGALYLHRQMVDLAQLAGMVVDRASLEYPDLDAVVDIPAPVPPVYADADKIEQVLTNLVENACKYASPQGVRIAASVQGSWVEVGVSDRGPGIAEDELPQVLTKFFHVGVGQPTGSGLGLWISRGLIEAHGGELRAESKPGQGSTFRFTLPIINLDELQTR